MTLQSLIDDDDDNAQASTDEADSGLIAESGDIQIKEATVEVQSDDGNKYEYSVKITQIG